MSISYTPTFAATETNPNNTITTVIEENLSLNKNGFYLNINEQDINKLNST